MKREGETQGQASQALAVDYREGGAKTRYQATDGEAESRIGSVWRCDYPNITNYKLQQNYSEFNFMIKSECNSTLSAHKVNNRLTDPVV